MDLFDHSFVYSYFLKISYAAFLFDPIYFLMDMFKFLNQLFDQASY